MDNEWIARGVLFVVTSGLGALLVWLARATAFGRIGRNSVAGIRTSRTMASDTAWRAAHVRAERPTRVAGVVAIVGSFIAVVPVPLLAAVVGVIVIVIVVLAMVLYAAHVGGQAEAGAPRS